MLRWGYCAFLILLSQPTESSTNRSVMREREMLRCFPILLINYWDRHSLQFIIFKSACLYKKKASTAYLLMCRRRDPLTVYQGCKKNRNRRNRDRKRLKVIYIWQSEMASDLREEAAEAEDPLEREQDDGVGLRRRWRLHWKLSSKTELTVLLLIPCSNNHCL